MAQEIVLEGVILSYPHLFTPRHYKNNPSNPARYGAQLILPENFDWTQVQIAIQEAIAGKWGTNPPANLEMPYSQVKDGPYMGRWQISANANADFKPQVVDQNVNPIIDQSIIFAGCIVNAYIRSYGQDKPGVSFGLNAVQLVDNVNITRLDGGKDAKEVFQAVPGAPAPTAAPTPAAPAPAPAPAPAAAPAAPAPQAAPPAQPPAAPAPAAPPAAAPAAPVPPGAPGQQPWNQ